MASVPVSVIPVAVTVFPVPTFLSAKDGVPLTVKMSPEIRLSAYVTEAVSVASYVLFVAVMVTARDLGVIFAVAVGEPEIDNV